MTPTLILLMIKIYALSYLRLYVHITDKNVNQRKDLELPYPYTFILETFAKFGG